MAQRLHPLMKGSYQDFPTAHEILFLKKEVIANRSAFFFIYLSTFVVVLCYMVKDSLSAIKIVVTINLYYGYVLYFLTKSIIGISIVALYI